MSATHCSLPEGIQATRWGTEDKAEKAEAASCATYPPVGLVVGAQRARVQPPHDDCVEVNKERECEYTL